ncbi:MAG: aminotransferase family protein [Gemmatimonadales bacterium]
MLRRYPESPLLYRHLAKSYPLIIKAEGCWLYDADGKSYLDGCGGAFVASLGHGVGEIVAAIADQSRSVDYVSGIAFTNPAAEALAEELAELALGDLRHFFFLSSGSDAVEAALKLARQYWVELGRGSKRWLVALAPAYHGNTLLALSAGARERARAYFAPWLVEVHRLPAPCAYRCSCRGEQAGCPRCSGLGLEALLDRLGPDNVAAFIAEPVGGASTGAAVPRPDYWATVREICTRHEVLWIADEVLVGAGRTGTWSALEPYGVVPDLQVLGKGLSGGYAPLAAVAVPRRLADVIAGGPGGGAVLHAQTFVHAPAMCAAGLAAIRYLRRHDLVARCRQMGARFHERLASLRQLPNVGDIRGRGLLAGIEFVEDAESRAPFPREKRFAERFAEAAERAGLVVWPNTGNADGVNGDLALLAPPFVITEEEIDELVERFQEALGAIG